jgi:kynureninase
MSASSSEAELERVRALDAGDPLASYRQHFKLPVGANGQSQIYLCGHSLGLAPQAARVELERELERWESLGVRGHDHGTPGWIDYAEALQPSLAMLAGAQVEEVVAMNSLSVNLHLLLASFYGPQGQRRAILIEAGAFSSDRHVVASQIAWHGGDPARDLIELAPAAGQDLLQIEDIEAVIAREGSRLSLVLWPGVQFRTGQRFDLRRIARAAHAVGAIAGFDLAHAIGNVPLSLHADEADFAAWCSYKYLNGGPGAVAGAFVHERHLQRADLPRLNGWWGHDRSTRFDMPPHLDPAPGAARWAISNPPVFSSAPLRASLPLFAAAGMHALRAKSQQLTGYLEARLMERCSEHLTVVTPAQPEARGCQLSVRLRQGRERGRQLFAALARSGVIADWRAPDIIRLAPVPLYNSFEDIAHCTAILEQALAALEPV